ncbi:hypothetical protein LSCM1_00700 [Leishmania martiniquensis]|uniref:ACB domain-containing protein n=1 Tax=Leishmania martiniquensis TaxID=1580590 RepID=A0A836KBA9_9TRYP|nr:hypothetical protein LSCM1_00700 [Leishmania martiniquensis]
MELSYPEKYHEVVKYFDFYIGDLETSPLLTDVQRLMFYALRQQADQGECTAAAPSIWHLMERHKHQAWKQLGRMSRFEAMVFFVQQFEKLLMQLEGTPAPSAPRTGAKALPGGIDWLSRLREMKVKAGSEGEGTQHSNSAWKGDGALAGKEAVCGSRGPSPAPATKGAQQESSPFVLSAVDMVSWDADIVSHSAPTLENIRYLSTELMYARHALRRARQEETSKHIEEKSSSACTKGPSLRECGSISSSASAACVPSGPPLKPIWCSNGSTARVPIVPPPVRPSARSMTEAAVRAPRKPPCFKKLPVDTAGIPSLNTPPTWFNWQTRGDAA